MFAIFAFSCSICIFLAETFESKLQTSQYFNYLSIVLICNHSIIILEVAGWEEFRIGGTHVYL